MAKSKTDLAYRVLQILRIAPSSSTADPEDVQLIRDVYDRRIELWRDDGLIHWPNTDNTTEEIPDNVFDSVAMAMCGEVHADFGVRELPARVKFGRMMPIDQIGLKEMRQLMTKRTANEDVPTVSY
jgi:hypothetical protein